LELGQGEVADFHGHFCTFLSSPVGAIGFDRHDCRSLVTISHIVLEFVKHFFKKNKKMQKTPHKETFEFYDASSILARYFDLWAPASLA